MPSTPEIRRLSGAAIAPWLDEVACLRVAVFRDWPYLYEGDSDGEYERQYLATYAASPDSVLVLALDGTRVVGASTGLPLADDPESYGAPLRRAGLPVEQVFYFGESVLLPGYRGLGLGHAFFDQREVHARALGRFRWTAFCAVDRSPDDPRRPPDYRANDSFWHKRGYARLPGLTTYMPWNEIDRGEIEHPLTFWLRDWQAAPA
ncbi:GNAT family N-acetyltransferase [Pseudoxanthomonas jiangsuensis]|uniref:GNAT family N-acetyltransferase n=1 Tax=Pseudoxanthomonas jiangsuensis TaxID=619688 RepID=UPI001391FD71|nr:GNAT family N-acetyltransferase [Pseudoxanthomonas jiangsuensis]KAF1698930.1 GNAT family N-acetyltransferase [Pseudoxanthomonas jiangsuensis]